MDTQHKKVPSRIKARLDIGNDVIRQVKNIVYFGQGNQIPTVETTHGRSAYLTGRVQTHPNYVFYRPLRNAGVTAGYAAGNCQDIASVVYTVLRSRLPVTETTAFCAHPSIVHWFSTIGNPNTDPKDEVVVVDPWPLVPQACLLEDHFCCMGLEVIRAKHGGKPSFNERLAKHRPIDATDQRVFASEHSFTFDFGTGKWWNHRACTRGGVKIMYHAADEQAA